MRNSGEQQPPRRSGRELPPDPQYIKRLASAGNKDYRDQRSADLRDSRDPREHSDLRDPRNSDLKSARDRREAMRSRELRNSLEKKDCLRSDGNWDPEDGRRDPRGDIVDTRALRETKIYGDERDFRDMRGLDDRDYNDQRKFGGDRHLEYFERERLGPYDPRSIDRRYNHHLPQRKNDSLSDLREDRRYFDPHERDFYRTEAEDDAGRFPSSHPYGMRESRRDIQDRIESERQRGAYPDYNKRDQPYLRRDYAREVATPYRGNDGNYLSREDDYHEKMRRGGGAPLIDSSYHHSLPRRDPYNSDRYYDNQKRFPPSPDLPPSPPSPAPPGGPGGHYNNNDNTRSDGRRGGGGRYYNDDSMSEVNMSESVLPRMKLNNKVGNENYQGDRRYS